MVREGGWRGPESRTEGAPRVSLWGGGGGERAGKGAEGTSSSHEWGLAPGWGPEGRESFPGTAERRTWEGLKGSANQPVLTFSSHQPAVPTPGSSGQCLRLQVSVCCKESSKWVGARGAALWRGPILGRREGVEGFREGCQLWPLSPVQPVGAPTAVCVLGQQKSHLRGPGLRKL